LLNQRSKIGDCLRMVRRTLDVDGENARVFSNPAVQHVVEASESLVDLE
jgi:hypothetical protein